MGGRYLRPPDGSRARAPKVEPMLRIEQWPELRKPVMVFAFTGWVDAGFAGSGTVAALAEALGAARQFASIDLSELLDLQQTRPTVRIAEGGVRAIEWPT